MTHNKNRSYRVLCLLLALTLLLPASVLAAEAEDARVTNLLLIGSDAREKDEAARSDVMLLVSVNRDRRRIVLTSFMRDIYTDIPGYGRHRLNTAYAVGGAERVIQTLEADFGLEIDSYAAVDFEDFASIIEKMGGLDLALTEEEAAHINANVTDETLTSLGEGVYHLSGRQVLCHCRNRTTGGSDAYRTDRQRAVITALMQAADRLSFGECWSLITAAIPLIDTDLGLLDILTLALEAPSLLRCEVVSLRVPDEAYEDIWVDGMAVLSIDFDLYADRVREAIYGE